MKALIIENVKEIMETIAHYLEAWSPDITLLYANEAPTAIELLQAEEPHLIILNLDLPTIDSFDMLVDIRLLSDAPIIALSNRDDEMQRIEALEIGADESITTPPNPREFLARVKALMRRINISEPRNPHCFVSNGLMINFLSREVSISGKSVKLTPIEYGLLTYLVKNEGRVISRSTLMEKVWGSDYINDYHLLKKYIYRLRQKLNDDGCNPQMLIAERGVGYKFIRPKN